MPAGFSTSRKPELEVAGAVLVRRFGGTWSGDSGMCRCPAHEDKTPSLSVRIGETRLLFKCFAGCDISDVLRALRRDGLNALDARDGRGAPSSLPKEWLQQRARDLWGIGRPINWTIAETYLRNRSIDIAPNCLRFAPRTPLGKGRLAVFRPAMLAAVTDDSGLLAVQRTFLDGRGRRARDLRHPRRLLGHPRTGAVRLAPAAYTLGIAEGVETAISAMILLGIPVWAALGNERIPQITIPESVSRLILLPDNDRAGRLAVPLAVKAHAVPGRRIDTIWPWNGRNDWNDVLRQGGKGVGDWRRRAA
ncbi:MULTISPECIES: DUF7146 domain-containing protein [unclassified Sphingopyxis]|uniref:Virulence-associated protein E n=2 Tax=Sphingomonadaceae TaxID=41297 RepID=A0A142VU36_9SPHN|nr:MULTISPECIES: toprim domain-containing protein [unclassified Sphingopyxis]AMU93239.1 virulence-associated protein E [Sphingopyxis terrae subsp. terrae NBRC 15098]PAL23333.1 virulence-associated protein E [Sphingopyxis sp. GW247-27LB]QXF14116.1 virulence-associated protein E [Sphingopyxis terrae subsp. terrae]BBB09397.1 hypothetical protein SPYCW_2413 [Sphingopyxis sp. EG6]HEV7342725.1 toprim domain-containing protein [Sphingopyxis sp.]